MSAPEDNRWQAVLNRDALCDGVFYYGVRSTGIYCRPSCGSRRPAQPSGVEFFPDPDTAERAGYRACLRCKPAEAGSWQRDLARVQMVCRLLEADTAARKQELTLDELSRKAGNISPFHLQKSFKRILGISPKQYLDAVRIRNFKAMLRTGSTVGRSARDAGFRSSATLYEQKATSLGVAPKTYRNLGQGQEIEFAVVSCPLGFMLLAATAGGVCSIQLGSDATEVESQLRNEFPKATIRHSQPGLAPFLLAALSAMGLDREACEAATHLPLDIRATAFQWRVWLALRNTPRGKIVSYKDIAASLGDQRLARAIGNACGANPVALAIPCHRAVRSDGSESGYRWGLERKRAILIHEGAIPPKEEKAAK